MKAHTAFLVLSIVLGSAACDASRKPPDSRHDSVPTAARSLPLTTTQNAQFSPPAERNPAMSVSPDPHATFETIPEPTDFVEAERPPTNWDTYTSTTSGYSLQYPAGWTVDESKHGSLEIVPPVRKRVDSIWIGYMEFEKPQRDDLVSWLETYDALGLGPAITRKYAPASLDVKTPHGVSQQAYFRHELPSRGQAYFISSERLVLQVFTYSMTESLDETLRSVADSIEFTADGPATLEQLWYPGPPPQYITIDDYTDAMQARSDAVAALNVRTQTGETPYELLKSDAAREEYERLLAVMAGQVEQNDQMPALQEQLAAHPLPTLDPSMSTYEEEERAYNQRLQEQVLLDASSPSQPQSPLAVLPTVTPTPAVSDSVPGGIPTERTGFVRHVQFTLYGPEYDPFEIWFDPNIWKLETTEGAAGPLGQLIRNAAPDCIVQLYGGGGASPMSAVNLAGQEWTVYYYGEHSWAYSLEAGRIAYLFLVTAPEDEEYNDTEKGSCQRLAEEVIDTFAVVEG